MPFKDPEKKKLYAAEYRNDHKEKINENSRNFRKKNPGYGTSYSRKWRKDHPEEHRAHVRKGVLKKYGIEPDDYERMVLDQAGLCAICGLLPSGKHKNLYVDHNHKTGKIRGLLCHGCNTSLGLMKESSESLRNAASYLERNEDGFANEVHKL